MIKLIATVTVLICGSFWAMCVVAGKDDERWGWK